MGIHEEEDHNPRKQVLQPRNSYKLKMLMLLLVITNFVNIYIFTGPQDPSKCSSFTSYLLQELNSTKAQLAACYSLIAELNHKINSTKFLGADARLFQLTHDQNQPAIKSIIHDVFISNIINNVASSSDELKLALFPQKLPLGYLPRIGSDNIYPPIGAGCLRYQYELARYMKYESGAQCPVDDVFAQKLMLKGCEPLPRRRCRPKSPVGYVEPTPFPYSLWSIPPDSSIIWDPYTCKSYKCLVERRKFPGNYDCKDCFDLNGREKRRWLYDKGLDYGMDQVLRIKPAGTIRIGFDIGGGSGTFAARMRERNVTIITSTMNLDGPFNSFIASRGLIPIHVSLSQRFPFFENTLDIVHSMHVLSNWIPDAMLELTFYDIYRVLRPGGLFWLDHFFCFGSQIKATYAPMLDRIGFKKLRWNVGKKLDRGKNEWYLSAVLEKPMT